MKNTSHLTLSLFFLLGTLNLMASPSSVLIIGGGPTGLGAAIEARKAGADVTLVEKRATYTRQNALFLHPLALGLFEKWNAPIFLMKDLEFKGASRGFVLIKDLEASLARQANEIGIQRIEGEFIDFVEGSHKAIIQTTDGNKLLPYDLLVGADGAHSQVRKKLGIDFHSLGESLGGLSVIPAINPEKEITVEIKPHPEVFVKKVTIPSSTLFFIQNQPGRSLKTINQSEMIQFVSEAGWQEEAMKMEKEGLFHIENVPVHLQRAATFSDSAKSVILLGDAASSASFYQGTGANFCFKTIQLAAELFRSLPQEDAYDRFNHDMEIEVTELINISLPLF